jgi:uncharacterized membrane protein YkoI
METPQRILLVLPIAAGLALGVSACNDTGDDVSQPDQDQTQSTETATAGQGASGAPSTGGTGSALAGERNAQAAVETAVAAIRGSSAVELDYSDRHQAWEVDVFDVDTELEVEVSPDGSQVLEQRESGGVEAEQARELAEAKVSMAEALATAAQVEAGNVDRVTLKDEDGKPVWEIEIDSPDGSSTEVLVDATTGEQIR